MEAELEEREEKIKKLKRQLALVSVSLKNAQSKLNDGSVISPSVIDDLLTRHDDLQKQIALLESGEELTPDTDKSSVSDKSFSSEDAPDAAIKPFRITRRPYTMSPEALAQRRDNAKKANEKMRTEGLATGPKSEEGKKRSSRNSHKHGLYAQTFFNSYRRPCKSTCPQYPCSLVSDGKTEPGEDCLDKQHVYEVWNALMDAVFDNNYDGFNALASFETATNIEILRKLKESILEDGVTLTSDKIDKDGNVIGKKLELHPALLAFNKMVEVLNMTPKDLMITPKALVDTDREKKDEESITDFITNIGNKLRQRRLAGKKPDPTDSSERK